MELDEGAGRRQQRHLVPVPLPEAHGAEKAAVERGGRSLEALWPHVLILEDVPEQAPHLGVRRPTRDRFEISGGEKDPMGKLGRIAPKLPPPEPARGGTPQKS